MSNPPAKPTADPATTPGEPASNAPPEKDIPNVPADSTQAVDVPAWKKGVTALASGFGLGYSPVASGTVGSAWGVLIVLGLAWADLSLAAYIAVCIFFVLICIPICHVAEGVYRTKDDGRIVADEYLTFPICMIGLTPYIFTYWWLLPMAFVSCRIFDILKLPPARQLERVPGGAGITLDDLFASLYSLVANWVAFHWLKDVL